MANESAEIDRQSIIHLKDFVDRKYADSSIVFCTEDRKQEIRRLIGRLPAVYIKTMTMTEMSKLYSFYCFTKFFDNIVFTYTDIPKDNMLGRYLKEAKICEEDAVCLALYHLRCVPNKETSG